MSKLHTILKIILPLILGILANLLSAWLQQDLLENVFTTDRVIAIIISSVTISTYLFLLENKESNKKRRPRNKSRPSALDEALKRAGLSAEQMSLQEKLSYVGMLTLARLKPTSIA